jgi:hypothetical protein
MIAYTCQISTRPVANSHASKRVIKAIELSATIKISRRFQRSTSAPANGPNNICGSMPTRVAIARMVADPDFCASHHTSANCTSWLPKSENACPIQMVKKRVAQLWGIS